jgi:hypothetical protein
MSLVEVRQATMLLKVQIWLEMNMEVNYLLISFLYNTVFIYVFFRGDYKYNYIFFNVLVGTYEKR